MRETPLVMKVAVRSNLLLDSAVVQFLSDGCDDICHIRYAHMVRSVIHSEMLHLLWQYSLQARSLV